MNIEIGNKTLKEMTSEDLLQIAIIEGCWPVKKHIGKNIWNDPVITGFDNKMFSDTLVLNYTSYRVSDNMKSTDYVFFFKLDVFNWYYTKDYEKNMNQEPKKRNQISFESIKYLINKGYDVPIYNTWLAGRWGF